MVRVFLNHTTCPTHLRWWPRNEKLQGKSVICYGLLIEQSVSQRKKRVFKDDILSCCIHNFNELSHVSQNRTHFAVCAHTKSQVTIRNVLLYEDDSKVYKKSTLTNAESMPIFEACPKTHFTPCSNKTTKMHMYKWAPSFLYSTSSTFPLNAPQSKDFI